MPRSHSNPGMRVERTEGRYRLSRKALGGGQVGGASGIFSCASLAPAGVRGLLGPTASLLLIPLIIVQASLTQLHRQLGSPVTILSILLWLSHDTLAGQSLPVPWCRRASLGWTTAVGPQHLQRPALDWTVFVLENKGLVGRNLFQSQNCLLLFRMTLGGVFVYYPY